jgi:hypothetical protein
MASKLDLADAQIIGFIHARWNRDDLLGLIEGMAMTKKEWIKLKKDYPTLNGLKHYEIIKIDDYFGL